MWPLETILDAVAAAGFEAVGLDHHTVAARGGTLEEVSGLLAARGLRCSDVGIAPIGIDDDRALELAVVLRAPLCIAALAADVPHERAVADLRAAAERLAPVGTRLAFEFTSYGNARTLAEAAAVCEDVGWDACGLLLDSWHVFRSGEPLSAVAALTDGRIALVHVNDGGAASAADAVAEGRSRRLLPGNGSFDLAGFAAALEAAGYAGPLSPEVLSADLRVLDPFEGARRLRDSLRSLSTRDRASRGTRQRLRPRRSSSA